jgi:DNA-binding FadR family transcriptional regulator
METRKALFQQHRKIFNAIEIQSPQKGRIAALDHFEYVEQKWKKAFLQQNKPKNKPN